MPVASRCLCPFHDGSATSDPGIAVNPKLTAPPSVPACARFGNRMMPSALDRSREAHNSNENLAAMPLNEGHESHFSITCDFRFGSAISSAIVESRAFALLGGMG
jgi:hypothetical protein